MSEQGGTDTLTYHHRGWGAEIAAAVTMCLFPPLPCPMSLYSDRSGLYLPVAVIGEDLITGQIQLVPLQQQLQLPVPVISVMFIGAESCRGGTIV